MTATMQGSMMMIFIYKQVSEQARQTLYDLIDNIPDAVIVLEPKMTPTLRMDCDQIRAGDIGVTFYDLLYCNQKTNIMFGDENTSDGLKLLRTRNLKKIDG